MTRNLECSDGFNKQPIILFPEPQETQHPKLLTFIAKLKDAVDRQDVDYITSISADNIKTSFGGDNTKQELIDMLTPVDAGNSHFSEEYIDEFNTRVEDTWIEFKNILDGPGGLNNNHYTLPYYSNLFIPDDLYLHEAAFVDGHNIPIYDYNNNIIDYLSYEVIQLIFDEEGNSVILNSDYTKIGRFDGRCGFIKTSVIKPFGGHRAFFSYKREEWEMTHFIVGD